MPALGRRIVKISILDSIKSCLESTGFRFIKVWYSRRVQVQMPPSPAGSVKSKEIK